MMSNYNFLIPDIGRLCETTGSQSLFGNNLPPSQKAIFKGWGVCSSLGGQSIATCGILEFKDGTVKLLYTSEFRFIRED